MHVMFLHPNFPAQFGHIAHYLATKLGWKCTFVTSVDTTHLQLPFDHINYKLDASKPQPKTFYNPDALQGHLDHLLAVYSGLRTVPQLKPDLVVGHISYGTLLYLRNLYDCPFLGYYELLPPPFWGEGLVLRKEYPPPEGVRLFNAIYHSLTYLHLHACDAIYTPTHYQLTTAPEELHHKIRVIHDGIDMEFCKRREVQKPCVFTVNRGPGEVPTQVHIGANTRVVTYVARGLESLRGFDIFIKVAKNIARQVDDVVFLIAGDDRTNYGHEMHHIGHRVSPYTGQNYTCFRQYVVETEFMGEDAKLLQKFHFLKLIPTNDLITLYSLSDLHFFLTAPFVLSWSMLQAMSSACVILGSKTPPVQEVLFHEKNGLLADFYDIDGLTEQAMRVMHDPGAFRHLGEKARETILSGGYEHADCTHKLVRYFEEISSKWRAERGQPALEPAVLPPLNG